MPPPQNDHLPDDLGERLKLFPDSAFERGRIRDIVHWSCLNIWSSRQASAAAKIGQSHTFFKDDKDNLTGLPRWALVIALAEGLEKNAPQPGSRARLILSTPVPLLLLLLLTADLVQLHVDRIIAIPRSLILPAVGRSFPGANPGSCASAGNQHHSALFSNLSRNSAACQNGYPTYSLAS